MVTPTRREGALQGYSPTGEEGRLHGYSPLGERMGCMVTSHWRSWFYSFLFLGKLVSGLLPAG